MLNTKQILAQLLHIASADKNIGKLEELYLDYVGKELGLLPFEIEEVRNSYKEMYLSPPTQEQERMVILYYLLFMMRSDRQINEDEVRLVKKYGFQLGFNELMLNDLIEVMIQYAGDKLPHNIMLEKVKPYLN